MLDADLPPPTVDSQLTGLREVSTINRAVGMLIDQGHHSDDAHATLRRHTAAGLDTPHLRGTPAATLACPIVVVGA